MRVKIANVHLTAHLDYLIRCFSNDVMFFTFHNLPNFSKLMSSGRLLVTLFSGMIVIVQILPQILAFRIKLHICLIYLWSCANTRIHFEYRREIQTCVIKILISIIGFHGKMIKLFSLKQQKKDAESSKSSGTNQNQKVSSAAHLRISKGTFLLAFYFLRFDIVLRVINSVKAS